MQGYILEGLGCSLPVQFYAISDRDAIAVVKAMDGFVKIGRPFSTKSGLRFWFVQKDGTVLVLSR